MVTQETTHPIILFDGVCKFCDASVNFVIAHDSKGLFRFLPIQSERARTLLAGRISETEALKSIIFIENGRIHTQSTAVLKILSGLGWPWKAAAVLRLVPPGLRDLAYDFVARNRYRWFGKYDQCLLPTAEIRSRFLE